MTTFISKFNAYRVSQLVPFVHFHPVYPQFLVVPFHQDYQLVQQTQQVLVVLFHLVIHLYLALQQDLSHQFDLQYLLVLVHLAGPEILVTLFVLENPEVPEVLFLLDFQAGQLLLSHLLACLFLSCLAHLFHLMHLQDLQIHVLLQHH